MPGDLATDIAPWLEDSKRYYSAKDLASLARSVGFRDDRHPTTKASELAVAVAIALAESGGDRMAVNASSGATGLWQIHPGGNQYLNAGTNAETAWAKYEGAGHSFSPWSTYTSKAYLVKLPAAEIAVRQTYTGGAVEQGLKGIIPGFSFVGDIAKDLATFFQWITSGETWIRLGEVVGGAILLLLALYYLFTSTRIGKDVRTVATKGAM